MNRYLKIFISIIILAGFYLLFSKNTYAVTCCANGCCTFIRWDYVCQNSAIPASCSSPGTDCGVGGTCQAVEIEDCTGVCDGGGGTPPPPTPPPCYPSCSAPYCGQPDGCGGTCPTSDIGAYTSESCGSCTPSGCGTVPYYQSCTRTDLCGNPNTYNKYCYTACNECGPTYGTWGACTAPTFTRSRSVNYDCQADTTQSETCYGTVYGTFFDASLVSDCTAYATQPKIAGADVTLTATANHTTAYPTTTNSTGDYNRGNLLVPDAYDLTYDLGAQATDYITSAPKLLCDGALTGISLTTQGQILRRRVGFWRVYGGWFQAHGADVYADAGITVDIPGTCTLPENVDACHTVAGQTPLIVPDGAGTSGVASYRTGSLELGDATSAVVSADNYQANSGYFGRRYDYDFFNNQTASLSKSTWDGSTKPSGNADNIYTSSGDISFNFNLNAGDNIIILHDGNVTINGDIDAPVGSFFAVIASGTITFDPSVTSAHGIYIADSIAFPSTGDENTELRFVGEGSFIGWDGISLERDRGSLNNVAPTEEFIFRPDFVINAPTGIRTPKLTWQEVAP